MSAAYSREEFLICVIARMFGDARNAAIGAASPIPGSAALLMRELTGGAFQVSMIHGHANNPFTDGGRELFDAAGQGAAAFNRKLIDIAQRNLNSGFDLAKSLAGAKNLSEMVELQAAYWQKLLGTLTSQAEEVRALSTKMAAAAGESLKEQVKRGVDELRKAN